MLGLLGVCVANEDSCCPCRLGRISCWRGDLRKGGRWCWVDEGDGGCRFVGMHVGTFGRDMDGVGWVDLDGQLELKAIYEHLVVTRTFPWQESQVPFQGV